MARDESPPFPRGEYDTDVGAFDNVIGRDYQFEDVDLTPGKVGAKANRTNRLVKCRLVKNNSGGALLPGLLVVFQTGAGIAYGGQVSGYAANLADRAYPVDEWIVAAGVPDQAYFYIVVEGPATVHTPAAGPGASVSEGTVLLASGDSSGDVGTVVPQGTPGSATVATQYAENYIGRSLQAVSSGYTGVNLLADIGKW